MENSVSGAHGGEGTAAVMSTNKGERVEHPQAMYAMLADAPGLVLFVDEQSMVVDGSPSVRQLAGVLPAPLSAVLPSAAAKERMDIARRVLLQGEMVAMRGFVRGELCWTLVRKIWDTARGTDVAMMTVRPLALDAVDKLPAGTDARYRVVQAVHHDHGDLAALSPRELEVLSLIGSGMTTGEIAKALHRSLKTVENHRTSIGKKLKARSLLQLSRIARRAGLPEALPLFAETHGTSLSDEAATSGAV